MLTVFCLIFLVTPLAASCAPTPLTPSCYDDQAGPRALNVSSSTSSSMSATACAQLCGFSGYAYGGVTGHLTPSPPQLYCYCGLALVPGAVPAKNQGDCNIPCPANASETCGGNYRLSVFSIACDPPIPPPGPPLAPGPACSQPETKGLPFCDTALPLTARVSDLVGRLTLAEIGPQLTARNSPAIPRLGIPAFYWGVNNVHGITNPTSGGVLCLGEKCATVWPSGPALGAAFNATLYRTMGHNTGVEMRAFNNVQWGPAARPDGMDGLSSWGPCVCKQPPRSRAHSHTGGYLSFTRISFTPTPPFLATTDTTFSTINLVRDPRWGRIQETASECPFLNGVFAREITRGLQEGEDPRFLLVAACLKHFAVYSLEDYHTPGPNSTHVTRENVNNVVSQFEAWDSYFPHFEMAVRPVEQGGGGAAGVMMAMNAYNGIPALASSELINILKEWSGPNNMYVTTDGGNMIQWMCEMEPEGHSFCPYHDPPCSLNECVEAAVVAGSDIADGGEYHDALFSSVLAGNLTLGDAQERLFNTLLIRFRLGLFDPTEDQKYLNYSAADIATPAAAAENAHAARQGLVLLQRGALPFPRGAGGTTTVLGFCANDTNALVSNYVNQFCPDGGHTCFPSLLQSIQGLGEAAVLSKGCDSPTSCPSSEVAAAVAAVTAPGVARVVLCLGVGQGQEAEQRDRFNITLPWAQQQLFFAVTAALAASGAAAPPLAVVLVHGGALTVPEVKASGAGVIDAFYPGPAGGGAIADALFGVYNPGGKLPYTVYDVPYQDVDFLDMRIAQLGRTYRYHTPLSPGGATLWPFGFGLSYTSFSTAYTGGAVSLSPAAPTITLAVRITNTGAADGDEVLQVYLVANASSLAPPVPPYVPVRALVAFQRLRVPAGQGVDLQVPLRAFDLNLTLSDGMRKPVAGSYTLLLSRGEGVGEEVPVPLTLQGF